MGHKSLFYQLQETILFLKFGNVELANTENEANREALVRTLCGNLNAN